MNSNGFWIHPTRNMQLSRACFSVFGVMTILQFHGMLLLLGSAYASEHGLKCMCPVSRLHLRFLSLVPTQYLQQSFFGWQIGTNLSCTKRIQSLMFHNPFFQLIQTNIQLILLVRQSASLIMLSLSKQKPLLNISLFFSRGRGRELFIQGLDLAGYSAVRVQSRKAIKHERRPIEVNGTMWMPELHTCSCGVLGQGQWAQHLAGWSPG